jgi:hypothetical protein
MECWNCKQLTDAFLAINPNRKGFAKCDACIQEVQKNGYVFIDLPYQPERSKREDFYQKLAKEYLDGLEYWEISPSERISIDSFACWLDKRCGALNIVETQ